MDEKSDPSRPADSPRPDAPTSDDPISQWAAEELSRVNTDAIILRRKQEYLNNIESEIAGKSPGQAIEILEGYIRIERDPDSDVTRHLERMVDALQYRRQQEGERQRPDDLQADEREHKAREFVRKNRRAVFAGAIFIAVILGSLAASGHFGGGSDEPAPAPQAAGDATETEDQAGATLDERTQSDSQTGSEPQAEEPAEEPEDAGYQPQSPTQPETPEKPPSASTEELIEGAWRFRAVNPPTGSGDLGVFTFRGGKVTTDGGAGGTYEVRTDADGTIGVEIELKDEDSPARTWFHMVLLPDEGILFGQGEALAINTSGNAGSTTTELKTIRFQTDIAAERVSTGSSSETAIQQEGTSSGAPD